MTSPLANRDLLDAPIAPLMRAQVPVRRLRSDPIDDDTLLTLLELASHATAGSHRRCEFVVVRDPDVRHQLARAYRQGWSIYRRVLNARDRDDALLQARQWEADHFEDVPVIVVACVRGRRPMFPAISAASFAGRIAWSFGPRMKTGPIRSWLAFNHEAKRELTRTLQLARGANPASTERWMWLLISEYAKHRQSDCSRARPSKPR